MDASILLAVGVTFATGLLSAFAGSVESAWVFTLHAVVGLSIVVLLGWKLARVRYRLRPGRWGRSTAVSILTLLAAMGALFTGVFWSFGGNFAVLQWNAMNVHVLFALLLVFFLFAHLASRFRLPSTSDFEGRRTALQYGLLLGGSLLALRLQRAITSALELVASRRFTSSRERGVEPGNTFPVTSWVADDPDPIDTSTWTLRVRGAVEREWKFDYAEFLAFEDERRAILDCTSGWYTEQKWQGVRIGRVLDAAEPRSDAKWVSFRSVTGYRWSLPMAEAREALLATHVGGEPLSHGHGAPARLVAPGRRGFQWVKWIESIEVRTTPDYGQWTAIFTSGFTGRNRRK